MADRWWYLLEINGLILLLFALFKLVQTQLSFIQQRWSLLAIPGLAILAVWMQSLAASDGWSYRIPVIHLQAVQLSGNGIPVHREAAQDVFAGIYLLGVLLFAAWMCFRLFRIVRLFVRADRKREKGCTIAEIPDYDSFSFFRWIQLRPGLAAADRQIVLEHEQIHVRKGHSFDLVYVETLQCLAWFNPIWLLFKKELVHLHEFEVDRIMYTRHRVTYMEFLVSYSLGTSSSPYLLTNQFLRQLTLMKRIKSMKQTTKKRGMLMLALPLAAGVLSLVSWTAEPAQKQHQQAVEQQVETEVDQQPEFKGGMEALTQYMMQHVKYPESAKKAAVTGTVMTSFIVTETGKVTNVSIKRGVDPALDKEAKRVVESMPDWIPAVKDNKKVSAEMILPISFKL